MKKFLALVLAVLMIASTVVSVAAFDDVADDNIYADAINDLQEYGIVAGTSETTFAPDELVTRWQMALFMARAKSGITDDAEWAEGAALFTDCTQYLGAIQYCYTQGIIKGVTPTEFAPNANIKLCDGIIMAIRALGYDEVGYDKDGKAVEGASYWLPYYQKADELGMLTNLDKLAVTKEMTRAETAQLIYNMLNTVVNSNNDNGYKYTLADVVFGGKKIVNVENVTGAFISQTPLQSIGADTIDDEDEIVVLTVLDDDNDYPEVEVPFADLEAAGVDVENIEEYFGAYIELVNCRVDKTWRDEDISGGSRYWAENSYIYQEYEYLSGVNTDNLLATTDADVTYHTSEDRIRIGNKTHYLADATGKKTNVVTLYTATNVEDGWEEINGYAYGENDEYYMSINDQLKDKFYDVTFIDADVDGYYEIGLVTFYEIEEYKSARSTGKEACGVMKNVKDVEYSEELSTGDIFVYTFNPFTKYVDVKEVIEITEGTITGYSEEKETKNGETTITGYVTIDGTKYTIDDVDPIDYFGEYSNDNSNLSNFLDDDNLMGETNFKKVTAKDLRTVSIDNVSETVEFYLFNDTILAFGDEVAEGADSYLVVDEFTDFELYDHVVLDAYIDGVEESIKVQKIYERDGAKKSKKYNFADLGYGKLSAALSNIFGLYTYTVDSNGYYVLTEVATLANSGANIPEAMSLKNYVTTGKSGKSAVTFTDWEVADSTNSDRGRYIRVNSATTIYFVNMDAANYGVEIIKPASRFSIDIGDEAAVNNARFIVDRMGYGDTSKFNTIIANGEANNIKYGAASVLYIITDADYVDHSNYKFVYVDADLTDKVAGDVDSFGLETGVEDSTYYEYSAEDGNAYAVRDFATVDKLYVEKNDTVIGASKELPAGLYLINEENIITAGIETDDINGNGELKAHGNVYLPYFVAKIKASNINLYDYNQIRLNNFVENPNGAAYSLTDSNNVQTIKFRFFEYNVVDETIEIVDKKNDALKEYMIENFADDSINPAESADSTELEVLLVGNTTTGFDNKLSFTNNTLCGIVFGEVVKAD